MKDTEKDKISYDTENLSVADVITIVATLLIGFTLFGVLVALAS